jgi:Ser/Thr protein kinase RdoA (MazF antagonist)
MSDGTVVLSLADRLGDVVRGTAGLDAVREVVRAPGRFGAEELANEVAESRRGSTLELVRTTFRPGRKLTAWYRRRSEVDGADDQHLVVAWHLPGAASDVGLVSVLASPTDPSMPQLARLVRPGYVTALAGRYAGADDDDLLRVRTLRYRPGQRHVLEASGRDHRRGVVVKVAPDDRGERAIWAARRLRPALVQCCPGADVVQPLGYSTEDAAAVWRLHAGTPLSHRLSSQRGGEPAGVPGEAGAHVARLGQAARMWHDHGLSALDPALTSGLPHHDVETELAATLRAGSPLRALLPSVAPRFEALVTAVSDWSSAHPAVEQTLVHGDLKADNVLTGDEGVRILDLDRVCLAEPALDLGKLLADLRWWLGDGPATTAVEEALRNGYGPAAGARWARADVLSALFQAKFAARRCPVHDPDWARRVHRQVERAWATLASTGVAR